MKTTHTERYPPPDRHEDMISKLDLIIDILDSINRKLSNDGFIRHTTKATIDFGKQET